MILFDTDICIELLRGNQTVLEKSREYNQDIAVSFMTVAELYYGAYKSNAPERNQELIEQFLITVRIIESEVGITKRFGSLKADLNSKRILIADADLFIASTALEKCEFLVTGNVKHFERIPSLVIQNWRE